MIKANYFLFTKIVYCHNLVNITYSILQQIILIGHTITPPVCTHRLFPTSRPNTPLHSWDLVPLITDCLHLFWVVSVFLFWFHSLSFVKCYMYYPFCQALVYVFDSWEFNFFFACVLASCLGLVICWLKKKEKRKILHLRPVSHLICDTYDNNTWQNNFSITF